MNHNSEHLKVIFTKCSMYYAITRINHQFKRSELKNVEKLVKQTFQALQPYKNRIVLIRIDWKCAFLYNL